MFIKGDEMKSRNYILNHDFGYGKSEHLKEICKLNLRNLADVKIYVRDVLNSVFDTKVYGYFVEFENDKFINEVVIKKQKD